MTEEKNYQTYTEKELMQHPAVKLFFELFKSDREAARLMQGTPLRRMVQDWDEQQAILAHKKFHAQNPPLPNFTPEQQQLETDRYESLWRAIQGFGIGALVFFAAALASLLLSFIELIHTVSLALSVTFLIAALLFAAISGLIFFYFAKENLDKQKKLPTVPHNFSVDVCSSLGEKFVVPVKFTLLQRDNTEENRQHVRESVTTVLKSYFAQIKDLDAYPTFHHRIDERLMPILDFGHWDFELSKPVPKPDPPPPPAATSQKQSYNFYPGDRHE